MRTFLIGLLFVCFAGLGYSLSLKQDAPRRAQPPPSKESGHIVIKPREAFQRHPQPLLQPPGQPPAYRHPGFHARWAPAYRMWVYVPESMYRNVMVLPVEYQLPEHVMTFAADYSFQCPHCGNWVNVSK